MLTTEIINSVTGLSRLRGEWSDLLASSNCNNLFLTWEWMHTWWMHKSESRALYIIAVRESGLLVGLAPLVLSPPKYTRMMPFPRLEFMAAGSIGSDYLSFILRRSFEAEAMDAIHNIISSKGYMVELTRVDESGDMVNYLPSLTLNNGGRVRTSRTNICPYIDLRNESWESYLSKVSHTHRKYFTRKLRKLRKDFSVDLSLINTEAERSESIEEFLQIHLKHWQNKGVDSAFRDPKIVSFHREFSRIALEAGWLRLFRLKLDGATAAIVYQFRYLNNYYYFQAALNDHYSKYSAGMLTLGLAIQQAISEQVETFDLLHDNEEYKYLWTDKERYLLRMEVYPRSFYGAISRSVIALKSIIRPPSVAYRRTS